MLSNLNSFSCDQLLCDRKSKKKKKFLVIIYIFIFGGDKDQRGGFHSSKPGGSGWSSPSKAWTQGGSSRNAED